MIRMLKRLASAVPTPSTGKVVVFVDSDTDLPSYKDETGTVSPLGTDGATGPAGPAGPDGTDSAIFWMGGAQGPAGERGAAGPTGPAGTQDETLHWMNSGGSASSAAAAGGGSGAGQLLAYTSYNPASEATYTSSSSTFADIDSTNLQVTFVAPANGKVMVRLNGHSLSGPSTVIAWNLRDGAADVANTNVKASIQSVEVRASADIIVTGLTPSQSYTYRWGFARTVGTGTAGFRVGGGATGAGVASMQVYTLP